MSYKDGCLRNGMAEKYTNMRQNKVNHMTLSEELLIFVSEEVNLNRRI